MTTPQALAFAVLAGTMGLFVWGRLRYDMVATLALLVSVGVGIVPPDKAFQGFSDDIVIIVGSALVVSAAVARSGVMEVALQALAPRIRSVTGQVAVLAGAVTLLSAFVKNIGALAMLIPVAFQMARRANTSPSATLMPMSFGALLGGLMTLVGTSPNIIVARVRGELTGEPFGMFDFAPVGVVIAASGMVVLMLGHRLIPQGRKGMATLDAALDIKDYTTEAHVTPGSVLVGASIADVHRFADGEVTVTTVIRGADRRSSPLPDMQLREHDTLVVEGDPSALERLIARADLKLTREDNTPDTAEATDEIGVVEAIVGPDSALGGQSAQRAELFRRFGVNLIAVSRSGQRFTERLRSITLQTGDIVVLQGNLTRLPDTLKALGCLPLAERRLRLGQVRRGFVTLFILAAAMTLTAFGVTPVAIGFFGAAAAMVAVGALPLRDAYAAIEWPILIMLGALIPVSDALRSTGATELVGVWLSHVGASLPPAGMVALVMLAAMAVTPFLNNAATVLVMAPIAASFARDLGLRPDAFLMAVAIGAACDFLTPIGHQCNTLVMGPGGYRFGDYWRLGLPLSLMVVLVGVPMVMLVWPLR
ncbi:SLC13 family permease [Alsobacter sp. SYSU M60028]|uniref:SLC13 family permease n=1 Tax=Alsobacter ponti TaxID=2962936 RepID=A0ABT1LF81_9HYPH|nr:SLC13 family permease [Alsobacter ponti]MCP8940141.1 SLC13 family permease [Alsobacter ponti]